MRSVLSIILIYSLAITSVFAQSVNPNDNLKIGNKSSSSDKGITFDTNDGVNNKKLLVEKISKKLKWDGNSVQIGDGSSSSDKELVIAGALKSLKYNGTTGEFEFNDDLKLSGELKSDILRAINTEVAVKSLLRAEQGIKVGAGSNEIRVNAGNLEFSNDGVLYKKFGTGTGNGGSSGISILENASFEDGITTGWTSSGGTFSQETYTNSVEGSTKYARFVATGAGQYFETTLKAIPDNFSGGCQADFKKVNVSANDLFKVEVLDSSSNILTFGNVKKSSWVKFPTISFSCPTAGSTVKLRVTSLAAGTIEVDDAYLGSNQNLISVSPNLERVIFKRTSSFATTINTYTKIPIDETSDSSNYPISSNCFTVKRSGNYSLRIKGEFFGNNETVNLGYTVNGGSVLTTANGHIIDVNGAGSYSEFSNVFYSAFNANDSICPYYRHSSSGARTAYLLEVELSQIGQNAQETAVSPEQSSWFIDANIGGSANPSLGTSSVSSYTSINDGGLDLVVNSNKGSHSAEIACAPGTSSSGLNCGASNESVGISFIPPSAGSYETCFAFSHYTTSNATTGGSRVEAAFQVVQTENNSGTILQEGGQRSVSNPSYTESQADSGIESLYVCGSFAFNDTSKKTIRLMYEQNALGSPLANGILADRSASVGQRDIKVTVRPVLSAYNRPILTGDQVTTRGAVKPELISVFYGGSATSVCTTTPCPYISQIGDSFTSVERLGLGSLKANFNRTFSKANCSIYASGTGAANSFGTYGIPSLGVGSCTNCNNLPFLVSTNNGPLDSTGTILCHVQP